MSLCRPYVALKMGIGAKQRDNRLTRARIPTPQVFHRLWITLWKYAAATKILPRNSTRNASKNGG